MTVLSMINLAAHLLGGAFVLSSPLFLINAFRRQFPSDGTDAQVI
jgi:hypothetical protein